MFKQKMIFVCNPNNPTGTIVGKENLLHFITSVPENILIILDEAYYEYVTSEQYLQSIPLLDSHSNLIILRTFSKIYGLAGLRAGYGMMNPSIVKELHKVKEVFNVNMIAQIAAVQSLASQEFITMCAEKNSLERDFVCDQLKILDLKYFSTQTNFLYVFGQLPISQHLISNGYLVRPMKLNGYADAYRMTFGTREDNEAALSVIKKIKTDLAV